MLVYPQWYDGVGTNKVRIVCHSEDYSELDQFEICFTLDFLSAFNAMELYHHGRFGGGGSIFMSGHTSFSESGFCIYLTATIISMFKQDFVIMDLLLFSATES